MTLRAPDVDPSAGRSAVFGHVCARYCSEPISKPIVLGDDVTDYLIIGLGGFLGANARYLVGGWVAKAYGSTFPYGTFLINVTGSFVIGFFLTFVTERFIAPPSTRSFFVVGFLGAYTTFSSYMFEAISLIQARAYLTALAYLLGGVIVGLIAVAAGVITGRAV
jgi:CrcB protein